MRLLPRIWVKLRIHPTDGEKLSDSWLGKYKGRQVAHATQHWRSCDDFGACFPQSFCDPPIFIRAQQLDFCCTAMAVGAGIAVNSTDSARRPAKSARQIIRVMP